MPATHPPVDSRAVRERLLEALRLDLVGPRAGRELDAEQLPGRERPSNRYVAGFLTLTDTLPERSADADEDDDLDAVPESAGLAEESNDERKAVRKVFFPSSTGLSFLVAAGCRELAVTVRRGDYVPTELEEAGGGKTPVWRRTAHEAPLSVLLGGDAGPVLRDVPSSGGLQRHVVVRPVAAMGTDGAELPSGTRSASCFLVNRRTPDEAQPNRAHAFQAEIEVRTDEGFLPRPDLRGAHAAEWDDQAADPHYADTLEFATGHVVSAEPDPEDPGCRAIRTAWVATAGVEKRGAADVPGAELSMEALARLAGGEAAGRALGPLVEQYRGWTEARRREVESGPLQGARRETAGQLVDSAMVAAERLARGAGRLGEDADLLDAFRIPNPAVARLLHRRLRNEIGPDGPRWRPFELSYLPLAAVAMALRRPDYHDALARAVVSVSMRYTPSSPNPATTTHARPRHDRGPTRSAGRPADLRPLTFDHPAREAALVPALKMQRSEAGGPVRLVAPQDRPLGREGGDAELAGPAGRRPPGFGARERDQVQAEPRPQPVADPVGEFSLVRPRVLARVTQLWPHAHHPREPGILSDKWEWEVSVNRPLPTIGADDHLCRRPPASLIAIVDNFASLPRARQSDALVGVADRAFRNGFYGPAEPGQGKRLTTTTPAPTDLVIHDELDLIAGPLRPMPGLHETPSQGLPEPQVHGTGRRIEDRHLDRNLAPGARPNTGIVRAPMNLMPEANSRRTAGFWRKKSYHPDIGLTIFRDRLTETTRQPFGGTEWDTRFWLPEGPGLSGAQLSVASATEETR